MAHDTLTRGNVWRAIFKTSLPNVIAMGLYAAIGISDTLVAGRLGTDAQAIIGFATTLNFFLLTASTAISTGTISLLAQAYGRQDTAGCRLLIRHAMALTGGVSLVGCLPLFLAAGLLPGWMGLPPHLHDLGSLYLQIFLLAFLPQTFLNTGAAIFRAQGDAVTPMWVGLAVAVANIVGNVVLALGLPGLWPGWGIQGIALSTCLSTLLGAGYVYGCLYRAQGEKPQAFPRKGFQKRVFGQILKIGLPAALQRMIYNLGNLLLFRLLALHGGTPALAAMMIGLQIESLAFLPTFALNLAAATLVGQNLGARQPRRAIQSAWQMSALGVGIMTTMGVFFFCFPGFFARLFTQDPAVVAETTAYLQINALSEPFLGFAMVLTGALAGAGDTRTTLMFSILTALVIKIPLAYLLAQSAGPTGVWIAMALMIALQGVLVTAYFRWGPWLRQWRHQHRTLSSPKS